MEESSPDKLFELAAYSYLEFDGRASKLYFQKAIESEELAPELENFAQLSIDRLSNPDKYGQSVGVVIMRLTEGGNSDDAGLLVGDVIIGIDGIVVNEPIEIASAIAKTVDEPIQFEIVRNGQRMIVSVIGGGSAGVLVSQLIVLNTVQL